MTDNEKSAIPSTREIAELGKAIYRDRWEAELTKTAEGKFVAVNIRTGEVDVADTPEEAVHSAEKRDPKGYFHLIRVGHKAAFAAGWYMSHAS